MQLPLPTIQVMANNVVATTFDAVPQDGQWHHYSKPIYIDVGGDVLIQLLNLFSGDSG